MAVERMSLVVFSGTADKLMAAVTMATGAAAMGMEVDLFLTFWGIEAMKKGARPPLVSAEFAEMGPMMQQVMQAKKVPHWLDTLRGAREIGDVHVYACGATMDLFDYQLADLEDVVDEVIGVAAFVDRAKDSKIQLFI